MAHEAAFGKVRQLSSSLTDGDLQGEHASPRKIRLRTQSLQAQPLTLAQSKRGALFTIHLLSQSLAQPQARVLKDTAHKSGGQKACWDCF